jgi:acyl-CoA thioesterase-1
MKVLFVFIGLFGVLFFMGGVVHAQSSKNKKLVIVGDSLTEGYGVSKEQAFPALLEKKIQEAKKNWVVVNAGISGSKTASAEQRVKWVLKSNPDMIVLALGANDGLRGLKVEESEKNLEKAILLAQQAKLKVVLAGLYIPPNYGAEYGKNFRQVYERLAKKHKLVFIPFLLEGVGGIPEFNLADGIHPNEKGHEKIAATAFRIIQSEL